MGVRFAMQRRDWKQLLKDRTIRILIPFIFGFFFITLGRPGAWEKSFWIAPILPISSLLCSFFSFSLVYGTWLKRHTLIHTEQPWLK
jgi:hypothetical protein